jgi:glutathione S-transferase
VAMDLPSFKLISFTLCPYVQRARIMLLEKDIPHEVTYIDLDAPPPWFYDISPLEKVPVLLVDDKPLFESMPICEFLDEVTPGSMHPGDAFEKAQNRAWIEFGNDILTTTYTFFTTDDEAVFKQSVATLTDRFDVLEEILTEGPFFNGEAFCIIDAVYAPIFRYHESIKRYHDYGFFGDTPQVSAWAQALLSRPAVKNCVPDTYTQELHDYLIKQNSLFSKKVEEQS